MRLNFRILAVTAAALFSAACGETATSPRAAQTVSAPDRAPKFDYSAGGRFGFQGTDINVSPNGGTYSVAGLYNLNFPANAVCDPDKSTYGDGEWNNSCVVLTQPITIHATLQLTSTGLAVDFQPELRFSPSAQVTISTDIFAPVIRGTRDYLRNNPSALNPLAVYYAPSMGSTLVADYLVDPDAITHVNLSTGRIWRRIKHFSGYNVTSGGSCSPNADQPDCVQIDQ